VSCTLYLAVIDHLEMVLKEGRGLFEVERVLKEGHGLFKVKRGV
jgi:hypothetical protein